MNYLTTTDLRTKSSDLIRTLATGASVDLIHRSRVVGAIVPKTDSKDKYIDSKRLAATLKKLEPSKKTSSKQLMEKYKHYMMYRHGPDFS